MHLRIIEVPRTGFQSTRLRKLLKLRCDECGVEFERRWQREVYERTVHFCCVKHMAVWHAKQPGRNVLIATSTALRMRDPDVRKRFEEGVKRRGEDQMFGQKISEAAKRSFANNPERSKLHAERMRLKFADPTFKEFHRSRLSQRINPWWKPWMEKIKDDIHWSNRIIAAFGSRCAICDSQENLCAHHVAPKSKHPELRHDLNNGLAVCQWCHIGKKNPDNVHRLLRTDPIKYESLMRELFLKRVALLCEDS